MNDTRHEVALTNSGGLAAAMGRASRAAREAVQAADEHEAAIRDVAAGVAAPVLTGYVLWLLQEARERGLDRLCFLSRDAQVLHEIARTLAPRLGTDMELRYVYSSRRTWSLAASDPYHLDEADWLFNSFIRSNATDVCARLGLDPDLANPLLTRVGASFDPATRADTPGQNAALRRFVALPEVARTIAPHIARMRDLVLAYARQEGMASATTGLVDAGWTGRMIAALHSVLESAGQARPHAYFWGHERRSTGGVDPEHLSPYMYSTAGDPGAQWRIPDNPYIIETFCMSDHSIVSGYRERADGTLTAELKESNAAVTTWGFGVYRATMRAFADALDTKEAAEDIRPVLSSVLREFWIRPTHAEAAAWGAYPYDSDPLGRSALPLARPFTPKELAAAGDPGFQWGDRAWLPGSLALSGEHGNKAAELLAPRLERLGAPATD
ncbi:hypothetical protein ABZY09_17655 [Streptomyces sp. NPDC002928]|uniref:hypothetical protein n=1 Tax=Streptomyces sp. NPDC002928 TaxID=3154440 RepID=UPI0033A18087